MPSRSSELVARVRAARATLTSAPWRRAPWLLRRRPGVLVAMAGACAVLAASLASVPLFLSAAGTEAVELQADERCPRDTGATYLIPPRGGSQLGAPDPFLPLADELGPSTQSARFETTLVGSNPSARIDVVVLYREEALDHVDVVAGAPRPGGVWVSDRLAEMAAVGAGGATELGGVPTPVAGVYRDLAAGTIPDPYWCAHRTDLLLRGPDLAPPPPVVIADRETFFSLEGSARPAVVEAWWEAPLRSDLTVTDARALLGELACDGPTVDALEWCEAGGRPLVRSDSVPTATIDDRQIEAPDAATFVERYFGSSLPFVVDRARSIQTAVGGGVWPVAVLATFAGAGLVAATALLWFDRRRREVALLIVRGVTPAAVALKAVLELAGSVVVGSAAGVGLAYALVVWLGPSSALEPTAIADAGRAGVVALGFAALVVAVVVAIRVPVSHGIRRRSWLRFVPWELGLGSATVLSLRRLDEWGVPVSRGASVSRIDVVGLMFPVLFLTTMVAVVARGLVLALRPLQAISRGWPSSTFLAVRRVARYRGAVLGIMAASAIATGVLGYSATIQRSMDATLHAKAHVFLGSDVVLRVAEDEALPDALMSRATGVDRYSRAWVEVPRRESLNVFAIDPATFERAAFWDSSLASVSLDTILERLAAPPVAGRVPAVVVGVDVPAVAEAVVDRGGTSRFEIAEVAEVQAFPGMRRGSPAMFVAASALDDLGVSTPLHETWVRGDRGEILSTLDAAGTGYVESLTSARVVDAVQFLTVSRTFGFMRSLGVVAALLVAGGVAVYLDARRRGRVLGYAFARRMGLTRRQHRRALVAELLAGMGVGCWLGLVVALVGAGLAHERIDPLPSVLPDPLLRPATALMVELALAVLGVAMIAAAVAQRTTDRDDPMEVLRGGA